VFFSQLLIVEDDAQLAFRLEAFLYRPAMIVRIAPSVDAATAMLGSFVPDLVVIDYDLPGNDALFSYDKIVLSSPKPPRCILLISYLTDALAERALHQGMLQLVFKPFSLTELCKAVDATWSEIDTGAIAGERRVSERRLCRATGRQTKHRRTWVRRQRQYASIPGFHLGP